jgi:hypothetical protein
VARLGEITPGTFSPFPVAGIATPTERTRQGNPLVGRRFRLVQSPHGSPRQERLHHYAWSATRFPVGEHQRERRDQIVLREGDAHPSPPAPPQWLGRRAKALFRELWARPESQLWAPRHAAIVARLAFLQAELEGGRAPAWLFSQIAAIEARLLLDPRALRIARVRIEPSEPPAPHTNGGLSEETKRRIAELEAQPL